MLLIVSIIAVRISRDFGKSRAGSNFPKNLQAPGHHNSSRLEFSKKNYILSSMRPWGHTAMVSACFLEKIRAGSNFPKILEAPGLENSSRLEFSKKNLNYVIYEALGSHSYGFSIFFRKLEPARIFRKFLKLQVSKTRAGSNFPKKTELSGSTGLLEP